MEFLKYILYPFSILYGGINWCRNVLFDIGVFEQKKYPSLFIISIGNLSVGGSGKTPHIAFLAEHFLSRKCKIAIVSRGYGRKTTGFLEAKHTHTASDIGDEPFLLFKKFKEKIPVYVSEKRTLALDYISQHTDIQIVLLDDAYQHRYVARNFNILLSEFNTPFYKDIPLPSGLLREFRFGAKRADLLVFTKSPTTINETEKSTKKEQSSAYLKSNTPILFSKVSYQPLKSIHIPLVYNGINHHEEIISLCGIAKPTYFTDYLSKMYTVRQSFIFKDHTLYSKENLTAVFEASKGKYSIICTEKDLVKLDIKWFEETKTPLYCLEIGVDCEGLMEWIDKKIADNIN